MKMCELSVDDSYGDLIIETKYWDIFLAPSQRYLGTCVISLKRDCGNLKDLKSEEWLEFGKLVEYMEIAITDLFNPDLFNWSCLKNSVFRKKNPKPHIHWHFIPRYENIREFEGLDFKDPEFGYFAKAIKRELPKEIQLKLFEDVKNKLVDYF